MDYIDEKLDQEHFEMFLVAQSRQLATLPVWAVDEHEIGQADPADDFRTYPH